MENHESYRDSRGSYGDGYGRGWRDARDHYRDIGSSFGFGDFFVILLILAMVTVVGATGVGLVLEVKHAYHTASVIDQKKITATATVEDADKEKVKISYRNDTDKTIGKVTVTLTGTQSNRSSSILEDNRNTFTLDVIATPGQTVGDVVTVVPRTNIDGLSNVSLQAKVIDFTYLEDVSDYVEAQKEKAGNCPAPAPNVAPTSASYTPSPPRYIN
jgi:hypothetical protein